MKDKQQALNLAKELQEYTRVVGSHNQKINQTADELVECLVSPSLTDDQQVVLDYLKNIYSDVYEDCTPLETMYLFGGRRAWSEESNLTDKEQFQVLAAFAEWGMSGD